LKKATLITHQGWADHFSCNGLVNYYASIFDELTLFAADEKLAKMLEAIYFDMKNIKVVVPKFSSYNDIGSRGETCVKCHMQGSSSFCPRGESRCSFVDYSEYSGAENIKVGAFKGYPEWERYLQKSQESFAHCFYRYEGLPQSMRIENFKISNAQQIQPPSKSYSVIHDDRTRGIVIGEKIIGDAIQLNQLSSIMIDTIAILENSSEIMMIDSNYSVLVYLLSFHNQKIASTPKRLFASARSSRDVSIYNNPTPPMWRFA